MPVVNLAAVGMAFAIWAVDCLRCFLWTICGQIVDNFWGPVDNFSAIIFTPNQVLRHGQLQGRQIRHRSLYIPAAADNVRPCGHMGGHKQWPHRGTLFLAKRSAVGDRDTKGFSPAGMSEANPK